MMPKNKADVGVVVGRFQVHQLHPGHIEILDHVSKMHSKMVVVLGLAAARVSTRNPLDFEARKAMILARYPKATVLYIKDHRDNGAWSAQLDALVRDVTSIGQSMVLYGGRDSFIQHYCGNLPAVELEPTTFSSATESRKTIGKSVKESDDFRAGVIWATQNEYPKVFPTVDIAVFREAYTQVLLVRKPTESLWRFPGGFVQPSDGSFESAARRELMEETGIECGELEYVLSAQIDDWRYRSEDDKIMTTFYKTTHLHGGPRPADDVVEAKWFDISHATHDFINALVPEHKILGSAL